MRMVVTAASATVYGKVLRAGEEFDCPDKECELWKALARAVPAAADAPKTISGEQLPLEQENASSDQSDAQRQRTGRQGRYGRRDMRAEG